MKLEVGMYARIDGKIGKVVELCKCEQCEARGYYEPTIEYAHGEKDYVSVYWKDHLKASHDIKKLVEENDFVNGKKITLIIPPDVCGDEELTDTRIFSGDEEIFEENIKTIWTHEAFEAMAYKVVK